MKKRSKPKHPPRAVLLAVLAVLLYLICGAVAPFIVKKTVSDETMEAFSADDCYSDNLCGESAAVIADNADALDERIRLIASAKERIILSTFEFRADETGRQVLAALTDAVERGVEVLVLVDGYSGLMDMERDSYFYALSALDNAEIRLYNKIRPYMPWTFMGRLHDKYIIVDDAAYLLGGRNTCNRFLTADGTHDWDVLVVSGTSSASLETLRDYFYSIWDGEYAFGFHGGSELLEKPKVSAALSELHEIYAELKQSRSELFESAASHWDDIAVPVNAVTLLSNPTGIYGKEPVLYYELTELMALNGGETVFHTPYIIANSWMLERLEKVSAECASLTMLTNSVGNAANIFGAAEYQSNRDKLLGMGIQLLEYDTGTAYHGKCVRIGDRLSVVGSMNFDMRSAYIDTELMLVIDSRELNAELAAAMGEYEDVALTVAPDGTVTTPAGQPAEPASAVKRFAAKAVHYTIGWAKFLF